MKIIFFETWISSLPACLSEPHHHLGFRDFSSLGGWQDYLRGGERAFYVPAPLEICTSAEKKKIL